MVAMRCRLLAILSVTFLYGQAPAVPRIRGALRTWQPVEIHFEGSHARESEVKPNPFLDFRLNMRLTRPDGRPAGDSDDSRWTRVEKRNLCILHRTLRTRSGTSTVRSKGMAIL